MKTALEAWGADSNLFHQGAAKQSDDPDVIAATMGKPGVVLKRPVGSNAAEGEHAERTAALKAEREAIDKKLEAENVRWGKERARLQAALKRARG